MISGLLTSHWVSRRFSRHWNAIDLSHLQSTLSSMNKKLFITPALEQIEAPSSTVTNRAEEARKALDDLFAFEAELSEALRDISQSSVDIELLNDVITQVQTNLKSLDRLHEIWAQSAGLFLGEDSYSSKLSVNQNDIALKSKIFYLANLCISMLQFLLQYLLQFSFKNDSYLRYWEERELEYKNWYWIETTPWFWARYLLQKYNVYHPEPALQHPKRTMRAKLRILRELRHAIAESVGRLTLQLNAFRKVQTLEDTQTAINECFVQCSVALKLFEVPDSSTGESSTQKETKQQIQGGFSSEWFTQTYSQIGESIDSFKASFISISARLKTSKIPNWFSTHWMHIGVGAIVFYFCARQVYESRDSIVQYVKDTRDSFIRFWHEHLELPLKNIWEAIRYDKTTLSVADKVSLQQDMESLGRMVADFAKDNNANLSESDLAALMQAAQAGDLYEVMKAYEQNIKSPIKNILFGDLVRLVLIQVQKQKVDLEKAMEALDQLLRANELNFQFLATIPAILLIGLVVFQFRHLFRSKTPNRVLYTSIHSDMRNLERMLNTKTLPQVIPGVVAEGNIGGLSYESYGLLLHITTKLQFMADQLAGRNKVWFEEDLKEIESEKTDTTQKLATIQRMYHTYMFLKNP